MPKPPSYNLRTFVAYVEDKPGVLNRIASLFRRRNYNIVSLNVGRTHEPGISRMTFQVEADADMALRIEANLYKMVNVLSIEDITEVQRVVRDLALIKVSVDQSRRGDVLNLVQIFRARAVDVSPDSLTVEVTGDQAKIQGMVAALSPFGILEMVQTGTVAMSRGPQGRAAQMAHRPLGGRSPLRAVSLAQPPISLA
ncbi:MAG TPA: acetolactate synthase small subunit [Polyangiaceae bacterium]|nr:acetolactate synthase small subunit [Polyangiaceae bacterium]